MQTDGQQCEKSQITHHFHGRLGSSQQGQQGIYCWLSSPAAGTKILGELGEQSESSSSSSGLAGRAETPTCSSSGETRSQKGAASRAVAYGDVDVPPGYPKTQLASGLRPPQPGSFCRSSWTGQGPSASACPACVTWVSCAAQQYLKLPTRVTVALSKEPPFSLPVGCVVSPSQPGLQMRCFSSLASLRPGIWKDSGIR